MQETEKNAVRRALTEERSRYCAFVHYLRPVLTEETGLVSEFQQLEEVTKRLGKHTDEPFKLPKASEQVLTIFFTSMSRLSKYHIKHENHNQKFYICLCYENS